MPDLVRVVAASWLPQKRQQMKIPDSDEFWAAIIGAVVGGLIAGLTQWAFARSQRKQQERALATSLLLKLGKLTATLMVTKQHVDDCFTEAGEVGPDTQPWQMLIPIANLANPIHFTSDEMSLLLSQGNDKIFHSVLGLDDRHNDIITLMRSFQEKRAEIERRLEPHRIIDRVDGDRIDIRYPRDVMLALSPYFIDLNSIVGHLREQLPKDVATAREATERAQTLLKNRLGLKFKLQINDPPASNAPPPVA